MAINREEIYDDLTNVIAPLGVICDFAVAQPSKAEITVNSDDMAQLLHQVVKTLKDVQQKLYV